MSDKNARTLSHQSNRATPRDTKDKKVAFKSVLDSPFRIQWPSVPLTLQNNILECIIDLLEGASDYHHQRCTANRKRKRASKRAERSSRKKKKTAEDPNDNTCESADPSVPVAVQDAPASMDVDEETSHSGGTADVVEPPVFLRHLSVGINAVTKRLEAQSSRSHNNVVTLPEAPITPSKPLKYVFVCRGDVEPPILIEHLPHLVAAYNSSRPPQFAKLVPLPRGSERVLAQILGIRRVAVLGIDADFSDDSKLKPLLEHVPTLTASWLSQSTPMVPLIQTHIKLLRTTVPRDMKEAKEKRLQGRAAAKQKRQDRIQQNKDSKAS